MNPTRILIAPNAFKHSLSATDVANAIAEGFQQSRLHCICDCFPVGDGGDGTGELIIRRNQGTVVTATVADPLGRPVQASFGLIDGGATAVIEMASASGIRLLTPSERAPLRATSEGTGQLIKLALDRGVGRIVLAIGGSATVDGGTGILRALGVRFLDVREQPIQTSASLANLARIDTSGLDTRLTNGELTILCDIDNTLLGPQGAAAVFGPQKGASPNDVKRLEAGLTRFAAVASAQTGVDMAQLKHGGAAGGVAAGLRTLLGAKLVNGIDYFLDITAFNAALDAADLVVTGEGSLDEQTLQGKGPFGVAFRAKQRQLPVIGLAGNVPESPSEALNQYFDTLLAIGHTPTNRATALQRTQTNLTRTAQQLGNLLARYVPA